MASPFLLRAVIDDALPRQDVPLLVWLVAGMVAVAAVTAGARRRADLALHDRRPAGHAPAAHRRLRAPAAPVARLLHPHPRRRGAVAAHQRHRRHAVGRHLDRHLDRLQPHHRRRHRGRDGRAELAAVAALAGRPAAGDLADPPGRPDAPRRSPPQRQRQLADLNVTVEEGLVGQRRAARQQDLGTGPALVDRFTASSDAAGRPRAALPARRPLADGHDEHHLRRASPRSSTWPPACRRPPAG